MKLTLTLLLFTLTTHAQLSINAGPNLSYFSGKDPVMGGIKHTAAGFVGGVSYLVPIEQWSINPAILYIHQGGRNSLEGNRMFSTYSLSLNLPIGYTTGPVTWQGGLYVDRLLFCKNYDFEGNVFSWSAAHWPYFKHYDIGAIAGAVIDFNGASVTIRYNRGFIPVKGQHWDALYEHSVNSGLSFTLGVPLSNFKSDHPRTGERMWRETRTYPKF